MNRTHLLLAIAAIVIVGIGVGLLLPSLQGGPLTGSIAPITPVGPWTMTKIPTPTPTPVPPVIRVSGTYSPYLKEISGGLEEWNWRLHSVMTYDATSLPAGVQLQRVDWRMTGARYDGGTELCFSQFMFNPPMAYSYTCDANDIYVGCDYYGSPFCSSAEWIIRPPFTASCTITATDGQTYTKSVELVHA